MTHIGVGTTQKYREKVSWARKSTGRVHVYAHRVRTLRPRPPPRPDLIVQCTVFCDLGNSCLGWKARNPILDDKHLQEALSKTTVLLLLDVGWHSHYVFDRRLLWGALFLGAGTLCWQQWLWSTLPFRIIGKANLGMAWTFWDITLVKHHSCNNNPTSILGVHPSGILTVEVHTAVPLLS
jgi:hypothetical protein